MLHQRRYHDMHERPIFPLAGRKLADAASESLEQSRKYSTDRGIPSAGKKGELVKLAVRAQEK